MEYVVDLAKWGTVFEELHEAISILQLYRFEHT